MIEDRFVHPGRRAGPHPARRARTPAEWILADAATLRRGSGRLEGRLLGETMSGFDPRVREVTAQALRDLLPVLDALHRTIVAVTGGREVA
jgi:hypothetical protein